MMGYSRLLIEVFGIFGRFISPERWRNSSGETNCRSAHMGRIVESWGAEYCQLGGRPVREPV